MNLGDRTGLAARKSSIPCSSSTEDIFFIFLNGASMGTALTTLSGAQGPGRSSLISRGKGVRLVKLCS